LFVDLDVVTFSDVSQPYYATNGRSYTMTVTLKNGATTNRNGDQIRSNRGGSDVKLRHYFQDGSGNKVGSNVNSDERINVPANGNNVNFITSKAVVIYA
jgi:hypothetical protein